MPKIILTILLMLTCFVSYGASNSQPTTATNSSSNQSTPIFPAAAGVKFLQPWARPTTDVKGKISNSAMYFTLINTENSSYNLVNISSDIANKIELHQTITDEQGVSKMVKVDYPFLMSANIEIDFKPGGMHIMLYDLKKSLNGGDKFKITFFYDDNSVKTVEVKVATDNPYNTTGNYK